MTFESDYPREREQIFKRSILLALVLVVLAGGMGLLTTIQEGLAGDPQWIGALIGVFALGFTAGWFLFRLDGHRFERTGRTMEGVASWTIISIVLVGGAIVRLVDAFWPEAHIYPIGGWLLSGGTLAGAIEPTHRKALRKLAERRAREKVTTAAAVAEWVRQRPPRDDDPR